MTTYKPVFLLPGRSSCLQCEITSTGCQNCYFSFLQLDSIDPKLAKNLVSKITQVSNRTRWIVRKVGYRVVKYVNWTFTSKYHVSLLFQWQGENQFTISQSAVSVSDYERWIFEVPNFQYLEYYDSWVIVEWKQEGSNCYWI